uniref:Adenylate cyclase n=1 Tax=Candidatus Kentrum sp. LPFa TaxID=2126335 RepID=A0A450WH69_9GAMM|nr:MAG: adenylate cyclase [Candidatus Kentron sp. LPFa]VFK32120.1 MAG: adenylate cyclase [Candidatus Kentron sp. LPFa]
MPTEIERKFLVIDDSWRQQASEGIRYRQGYFGIGKTKSREEPVCALGPTPFPSWRETLTCSPNAKTCSVRVRVAGDKATLNIKGATLRITRHEYEYPIPLKDAEEMLALFCERPFIEKTRYLVKNGVHTWEIDVFEGDNAGLIVAEIELSREDEAFEMPPWAGRDVSQEARYYNVCLREHPYKDW